MQIAIPIFNGFTALDAIPGPTTSSRASQAPRS